MFGLLRQSNDLMEVRRLIMEKQMEQQAVVTLKATPQPAPVAVAEPEPFPDKPERVAMEPSMSEDALQEYAATADAVGVNVPELLIERFKMFMAKHDLPIYDLKAVVTYMDAVAKRDNPSGWGWEWKALRASDCDVQVRFGQAARYDQVWEMEMMGRRAGKRVLASDYLSTMTRDGLKATPYDKVVPLHALKRVAMIEREFGKGRVNFAVTDYTTDPHIAPNPDPFLMAFVPNAKIAEGVGRFVIDVWDEPGFGIVQMLK